METPKKMTKVLIGSIFKKMLLNFNSNIKIIIMYHRVVEEMPTRMHDPNLFVTSNTLDMHIKELKKYFNIVSLEDLMCDENNTRSCALTFDDGWKDNYDIAFPILRKNKTPATVFLPVKNIGTAHWFWFEHIFHLANVQINIETRSKLISHFKRSFPQWGAERLCISSILQLNEFFKKKPTRFINEVIQSTYIKFGIEPPSETILIDWAQVYEMGENGISFGSHGLEHDILPLLDSQLKKEAVNGSFAILRDKTYSSVPFFSYPNGNWDLELVELLKTAGYHGATITKIGCADKSDPYLLRRIGCSEISSNTRNLFWFQIAKAFFDSHLRLSHS